MKERFRSYKICHVPNYVRFPKGGVDNVVWHLSQYFDTTRESRFAEIVHVHADCDSVQVDIAHCHGWWLEEDWGHSRYHLNNKIFGNMYRAKEVIVPSRWYLEKLQELGIQHVHRVPNGVDLRRFACPASKGDYVLYVGNWNEVKNGIDIVRLAEEFPDVKFKLTTTQLMEVPSNVEFLGPIDYENVPLLYRGCMFTISPFHRESFGIATLEAFASGKPVLGKSGGGNTELIDHGRTGYLYEDFDSMVDGAETLLSSAQDYRNECIEMASNYEWSKVAEQVARIYDRVWKIPVSVVVLAYNNHNTLDTALDSIGNGPEVVLADASHNHQAYRPERRRFKYIQTENISIGDNRNKACEVASEEFVTFCDGDDYQVDGKVSQLYHFFRKLPKDVGMVFGNGWWGGTTFAEATKDFHAIELTHEFDITADMILKGNFIPSGAVMFRKGVWEENKFNGFISFGEDYDFYLRILDSGYRIVFVDALCYVYNLGNPDSISKSGDKRLKDLERVLLGALKRKPEREWTHNELGIFDKNRLEAYDGDLQRG